MNFFDRFKSKFAQRREKSAVKAVSVSDSHENMKALHHENIPKAQEPTTSPESKKGLCGDVLMHPLVTEKTAVLAGSGKYVFVVNPHATKIEVKKAVLALYGTMPESVAIVNREGKRVRFGRFLGQRKDWKKAIVTMPEGKTLPIYE